MKLQNEVLDCIRNRRSTRKFKAEQIAPKQLDALLEAAIWAPSGGNSQSWLFTAIQNKETLLRLNEFVRSAFQTWIPDDAYPAKHNMKQHAASPSYNFYYNAPTLIIASNIPGYENAMADCSLALENIMLAAQSIGLGSCYINQLHWLRNDGSIREYLFELGIPREHTICSSVAIGLIGQETPANKRKPGSTRIIT